MHRTADQGFYRFHDICFVEQIERFSLARRPRCCGCRLSYGRHRFRALCRLAELAEVGIQHPSSCRHHVLGHCFLQDQVSVAIHRLFLAIAQPQSWHRLPSFPKALHGTRIDVRVGEPGPGVHAPRSILRKRRSHPPAVESSHCSSARMASSRSALHPAQRPVPVPAESECSRLPSCRRS